MGDKTIESGGGETRWRTEMRLGEEKTLSEKSNGLVFSTNSGGLEHVIQVQLM